jgi:hypothetical protein
MSLGEKSVTELREIAQGLGVGDVFTKTIPQLMQDIEQKHKDLMPAPKIEPAIPNDGRFRSGKPSEECSEAALLEVLEPYIARGLKVSFKDGMWRMSFGVKNDTGTMRMPLRIAAMKARDVLK